jgi:hypothetical protein
MCLGFLLDFITFCDRDIDLNVTRASEHLLPWWGAFIGDAKSAKIRVKRVMRESLVAFKDRAMRAAGVISRFGRVFGDEVKDTILAACQTVVGSDNQKKEDAAVRRLQCLGRDLVERGDSENIEAEFPRWMFPGGLRFH